MISQDALAAALLCLLMGLVGGYFWGWGVAYRKTLPPPTGPQRAPAPTEEPVPLLGRLYQAMTGRSHRWPAVRRGHLAAHPFCEACGRAKDLDVHHVRPFHLYPELELVGDNLMTLCRTCHWVFGHCGVSWSCYNPLAREEAIIHLASVVNRLTAREEAAA